MFALSFFGIIHVPINVPALGAAVKEDAIDVNRELIAHGIIRNSRQMNNGIHIVKQSRRQRSHIGKILYVDAAFG